MCSLTVCVAALILPPLGVCRYRNPLAHIDDAAPATLLADGITLGDALGMIETRGLVVAIEAADAMVKAADVEMIGWQIVGGGLITTLVRGDVATEAGEIAARAVGEVVAVHVIARPHTSLLDLLPAAGFSRHQLD